MANKPLPTLGVLGVYTGILLKKEGFGEIHEVMDHLYPGIMTMGLAYMAKTASKEILRQHPEFASLPHCTKTNYQEFAAKALSTFGETITVDGPHGTGNPDMHEPEESNG